MGKELLARFWVRVAVRNNSCDFARERHVHAGPVPREQTGCAVHSCTIVKEPKMDARDDIQPLARGGAFT